MLSLLFPFGVLPIRLRMRTWLWITSLPFCVVLLVLLQADSLHAGVIDFEGFPDNAILTTQYPGLTFSNTIILTAGISLNEFELPAHSGINVAFDNSGPISIVFDAPVLNFSGFFTYAEAVTLTAFGITSSQVAAASSAFSSNLGLSGDPGSSTNEFLSVSFAGGISSVTIAGDPGGGSFAMDDVTTIGTSAVPEPTSVVLTMLVFTAVLVRHWHIHHPIHH